MCGEKLIKKIKNSAFLAITGFEGRV